MTSDLPSTEPTGSHSSRLRLPVDDVLDDLIEALTDAPAVVLKAPTGSGKTTRVPPGLLDGLTPRGIEDRSPANGVIVLEPRRLAARAAARRIAQERSQSLGGEIGYHVRFDRKASDTTRLLVVTEGIFIARLQADPFLEGVGVVIFDEVHERSLNTDLALAMCRQVQLEVRPDLKVVAMSATLDPEPIADWLDGCPIVETTGRLFPVTVDYGSRRIGRKPYEIAEAMAEGVRQVVLEPPETGRKANDRKQDGGALDTDDVLAFLPGVGEIRRTQELLEPFAATHGLSVVPLFGDLPAEKQDSALRRGNTQRIVLATNVAESSVTVDGVRTVVDCGLVRRLRSDVGSGLDRLEIERISQASADQRAGRAGRQGPGHCLRLWPEVEHTTLPREDVPEIHRLDLAAAVLQLNAWGEREVEAMPWFEAPPQASLAAARTLLLALGAIDDAGSITPDGRRMAAFPVHPRLGRLMIEGFRRGVEDRAALAAALLFERSPFERRTGASASRSDLLDRVEALEGFESGRSFGALRIVNRGAARFLLKTRDQLLSLAGRRLKRSGTEADDTTRNDRATDRDSALLEAVFAAFSDRLARRRAEGDPRAVMVGGRGVRLARESAVLHEPLFVCVDLDGGRAGQRSEALVRLASGIGRDRLPAARISTVDDVELDPQRGKIIALRRERFDDLVLSQVEVELTDFVAAESLLADLARADPQAALGLDRPDVRSLLERIRFLGHHRPELELPSLDPASLDPPSPDLETEAAGLGSILPALCQGRRSVDELRRAPVADILLGVLSHAQRQALDREAPERLRVPSGSRIRLAYDGDRAPVLAVKIQEMFGCSETPKVAGGRVPVLLHLLAPNGRPQQVTDDLASFWANTYTSVRKELAGRYPKHAWPDDPLAATPHRRPQRRKGKKG